MAESNELKRADATAAGNPVAEIVRSDAETGNPRQQARRRYAGRALASRVRRAWLRFIHDTARQRARRESAQALYAMDERLLRDIGIERGQIPLAVEGLLNAGTKRAGVVIPFTGNAPGNGPGTGEKVRRRGDKAA